MISGATSSLSSFQVRHHSPPLVSSFRAYFCSFVIFFADSKIEKLQDFLSGLFEPPSDLKPLCSPEAVPFKDDASLGERFASVLQLSGMQEMIETALQQEQSSL